MGNGSLKGPNKWTSMSFMAPWKKTGKKTLWQ